MGNMSNWILKLFSRPNAKQINAKQQAVDKSVPWSLFQAIVNEIGEYQTYLPTNR